MALQRVVFGPGRAIGWFCPRGFRATASSLAWDPRKLRRYRRSGLESIATRYLGSSSYRRIDQKGEGNNNDDDAQHDGKSGSLSPDCGTAPNKDRTISPFMRSPEGGSHRRRRGCEGMAGKRSSGRQPMSEFAFLTNLIFLPKWQSRHRRQLALQDTKTRRNKTARPIARNPQQTRSRRG